MKFFAIIFFYFITSSLISQSIAPDFTLNDVNGFNRNLYAELNANKTVILDFFLTNCGTCINNSQTIENIWQTNGYNGDSLWVWSIEIGGESDSTITAFNLQNNITNPSFSTMFNDTIINLYQITYAPQYCVICSNKLMKFVSINNLLNAINGCKQVTNSTNINLQAQKRWFKFYNDELHFYLSQSEFPAIIKIYNIFGSIYYNNYLNSNSDFINLSTLNNGIYLISILTSNGKIINSKFIKN